MVPALGSLTRRRLLAALGLLVAGAPLRRLARRLARSRRRRPDDLPPVPWIGHC